MSGSGPKNFKEMEFPPSRRGKAGVYAPVSSVYTKKITPAEVAAREQQLRDFKKYINTLKCPVCQAQLDGHIGFDRAEVYCRNWESEYKAQYIYTDQPILKQSGIIYQGKKETYLIESKLVDDKYYTAAYLYDMNLPLRQRLGKPLFEYTGKRLMFDNLTAQQIDEKIKLLVVFS